MTSKSRRYIADLQRVLGQPDDVTIYDRDGNVLTVMSADEFMSRRDEIPGVGNVMPSVSQLLDDEMWFGWTSVSQRR